MKIDTIYLESCLETMDRMEKENFKVQCIITSPPYNVDLGNNKYNKNPYSLYKDNKPHEDYINWLEKIFTKAYNILEDGGRLCINIGNGKNGKVPTVCDLIQRLTKREENAFLLNSQIIWDKKHVSARTAWGSWKSPKNPSYLLLLNLF